MDGHRTARATLTVTADGEPLAGREVLVAQRSHEFLFGCTAFEFSALADAAASGGAASGGPVPAGVAESAERWLDLFNFATLPFYWGRFEPVRGQPDTARLRRTARWLAERGCVVKGHPLAWHTVSPDWLTPLPTAEIAETLVARIRRDVGDFAGLIDAWDVINEVVIMPIFDRYDNGVTRL